MSFYEDLTPNTEFGRWDDILLSVGWLDSQHSYARGPVSREMFLALARLLVEPWQPGAFAGRAPCSFCRFTGGPGALWFEGMDLRLGSANLFVPSLDHKAFVSPSMIVHYIDAHEYCPPASFQEAVMRCPPMGSLAYRKELRVRGITPLQK